jgi:hypothetical protein
MNGLRVFENMIQNIRMVLMELIILAYRKIMRQIKTVIELLGRKWQGKGKESLNNALGTEAPTRGTWFRTLYIYIGIHESSRERPWSSV